MGLKTNLFSLRTAFLNLITPVSVFVSLFATNPMAAQPCKDIIGYYPAWQWYDRNQLVRPATIHYTKYTMINYSFFKPLPDGRIVGTDEWADQMILEGEMNWKTVPASHDSTTSLPYLAHRAGVKLLISVGGWSLSNDFPTIAADPIKRQTFAKACKDLIQKYNLDGIDIDWEYPGYAEHSGTSNDKRNCTLLYQAIRSALDTYGATTGKKYLLTAAFGASPQHFENIEWSRVIPLLDRINLMTYDFFGAWNENVNHNAPLYATAQIGCVDCNIQFTIDKLINTYNVPKEKLVAGVAFYGRSQKTVGTPYLYAPSTKTVDNATFPEDEGSPLYYNIVSKAGRFDYHWDEVVLAPYLTGKNGLNTFVSYDNKRSIARKAQYYKDRDIKGVIIWEMTGDYLETAPNSGVIAGTPLLDTLNQIFCKSGARTGSTTDKSVAHWYEYEIAPNENNQINLLFNVAKAGTSVSAQVYDMRGLIVVQKDFGSLPKGAYQYQIPETAGLKNNVYIIVLKIGDKLHAKKWLKF
jgi:chitinase